MSACSVLYRSLLILYFVFYLYFVFVLLPIWRIKPDDRRSNFDFDLNSFHLWTFPVAEIMPFPFACPHASTAIPVPVAFSWEWEFHKCFHSNAHPLSCSITVSAAVGTLVVFPAAIIKTVTPSISTLILMAAPSQTTQCLEVCLFIDSIRRRSPLACDSMPLIPFPHKAPSPRRPAW